MLKREDIKKVSIIGAGYIGVELAEAVRIYGKETTMIDALERILQRYYDKDFTELMDKRLKDQGIKIELNQLVQDLIGKNGKVEKIKTNKIEIPTDLVIFAIGALPNTGLFKNSNLKMLSNGAIIVDKYQKTNIDNVYAIGDCATIYNTVTDKVDYIALASNAVRTGKVVAYNILGRKDKIDGASGSNAISIYGLNMVSTGLNFEAAKRAGFDPEESHIISEQKPAFMNEPHKVKVKVIYDKKTKLILGAQMASTYDISMGIHMFSLAIAKKTTIEELKYLDFFFLPRFNQPFNYINDLALKTKND
jgi:NADPH-dependent 2,4-dienoyl-CoA reductase/sulfur reductase-like enzyme